MAMFPVSGLAQVTQIASLDESHAGALDQFLAMFLASEDRLIAEGERTATASKRFMEKMQQRFATLSKENRSLREELVREQGRHREIEVLHASQIEILKKDLFDSRTTVDTLRNEMHAAALKADASITAAIAARAHAVADAVNATTSACSAQHVAARAQAVADAVSATTSACAVQRVVAINETIARWKEVVRETEAAWQEVVRELML